MKTIVNGKVVDIPTDADGKANAVEVRRILSIPSHRALIMKKQNGENQLVPKHGSVDIDPSAQFMEDALGVRG